jgi:hypothetical protein
MQQWTLCNAKARAAHSLPESIFAYFANSTSFKSLYRKRPKRVPGSTSCVLQALQIQP